MPIVHDVYRRLMKMGMPEALGDAEQARWLYDWVSACDARQVRQEVKIDRLTQQRNKARRDSDELIAAIEELGNCVYGKSWRHARAKWWQRCKRAVEAVTGTQCD